MRGAVLAALALALAVLAGPALAQDGLRELRPGERSDWAAVGRLEIGNGTMCTGALIEPNLVLTAAHCVFGDRSRREVAPGTVLFRAGYSNGRSVADRRGARIMVHRDYVGWSETDPSSIESDVALIELDQPITDIRPFDLDRSPGAGRSLSIVSYARGRSEVPSIEEGCRVDAVENAVIVMDCEVDFGASGSPVFVVGSGTPRVASLVSAQGDVRGRPASFGMVLSEGAFRAVRSDMARGGASIRFRSPGGSLADQLGR